MFECSVDGKKHTRKLLCLVECLTIGFKIPLDRTCFLCTYLNRYKVRWGKFCLISIKFHRKCQSFVGENFSDKTHKEKICFTVENDEM